MGRNIFIGLVFIFLITGGFIFYQQSRQNGEMADKSYSKGKQENGKADYQAGFAIFTNGTFRIFTAGMYHNLSPDVYIQAQKPNVIYVKKKGITWGDFFETLPFKLTEKCLTTGTQETFCTGEGGELKFFLNGELVDDLLSQKINDGDRALITFGNQGDQQIEKEFESVPTF